MKKQDLIAEVKKRRSMTDEELAYLEDELKVQDALDRGLDKEQVEYLVRELDRLPNRPGKSRMPGKQGHEGPPVQSGSDPFAVELTDAETERARWSLEIQMRHAAEDPRVAGFRELHLPDGLLAPGEAEGFLESIDAREVAAIASYLKKLHGWHEGEAAWWALTGAAPSVRPVRVSYRASRGLYSPDLYLVTLEAPPWISVKTFAAAFAEMKKRMRAERKLPNAHAYRVAKFIEAQLYEAGADKSTFEDMRQQWNRENPAEKVSDARTFWKIYKRLPVERITHPPYSTKIKREDTPEKQRQLERRRKAVEYFRQLPPPTLNDTP